MKVQTRGFNQDGTLVCSFDRTILVKREQEDRANASSNATNLPGHGGLARLACPDADDRNHPNPPTTRPDAAELEAERR
ncbi:MAG: hypothetical protein R3E48_11215 [Burkholderiaceae bacterium]